MRQAAREKNERFDRSSPRPRAHAPTARAPLSATTIEDLNCGQVELNFYHEKLFWSKRVVGILISPRRIRMLAKRELFPAGILGRTQISGVLVSSHPNCEMPVSVSSALDRHSYDTPKSIQSGHANSNPQQFKHSSNSNHQKPEHCFWRE